MAGRGAGRTRCRGWSASTSRPGAWTGRARTDLARVARRARRTGRRGGGRHPRRRVRGLVRRAGGAARGRRADRRRPVGGDALRRLVLRDRGGAHPRRRPGRSRRSAAPSSLSSAARSGAGGRRGELAACRLRAARRWCWSAASPGTSARARRRAWWPWSRRWRRSRSPGRLVFAPIPNVVATTDIVLITGLRARRARPGSRSARWRRSISNIWLGQGPWTPWEMAGWGLVGLGGAALAAVTGRRLGRGRPRRRLRPRRLRLRRAARLLGDGHLRRRAVARPLPGDLRARGPVQRRPRRGQRRARARRRAGAGADDLALPRALRVQLAPGGRGAAAWCSDRPRCRSPMLAVSSCRAAATRAGVRRLRAGVAASGSQNPDGGFGARPAASSSAAITGWAVLGLEAAGRNPLDVRQRRAHADRLPALGGRRPALDRRPRADDPRPRGAGVEPAPVRRPRPGRRSFAAPQLAHGSFEGQVNLTAFGDPRAALRGRAASALGRSAAWLRRAQNRDGGWGFQPSAASDAGQHRRRAPGPGRRRRERPGDAPRASRYLRRAQRSRRRLRAGRHRRRPTRSRPPGRSRAWSPPGPTRRRCASDGHGAFDYLASAPGGDGHYRYSSSSDQTPVWVTGQALLAVSAQGLPARRRGRAPERHKRGSPGGSAGRRDPAGRRVAPPGSPQRPAPSSHRPRSTRAAAPSRATGSKHRRRGGGRRPRPAGTAPAAGEQRTGAAPASLVAEGRQPASAPPAGPRGGGTAVPTRDSGARRRLRRGVGSRPSALALAAGFLWYRRRHRPDGSARVTATVSAMDVETAIRTRRTHKAFRPEPVDRAVLDELFELARWAPNHNLTNPWRFRVVGPRALERLKEAAGPEAAAKLDRAPTLVVCSCALSGDAVQDEEDLHATAVRRLHRPARRPRARAGRLLAHAGGAAHRRRARARSGLGDGRAVRRACIHLGRAGPGAARARARAGRRRRSPTSTDARCSRRCRRTRGARAASASTWS